MITGGQIGISVHFQLLSVSLSMLHTLHYHHTIITVVITSLGSTFNTLEDAVEGVLSHYT
jgi:hypothetical protein